MKVLLSIFVLVAFVSCNGSGGGGSSSSGGSSKKSAQDDSWKNCYDFDFTNMIALMGEHRPKSENTLHADFPDERVRFHLPATIPAVTLGKVSRYSFAVWFSDATTGNYQFCEYHINDAKDTFIFEDCASTLENQYMTGADTGIDIINLNNRVFEGNYIGFDLYNTDGTEDFEVGDFQVEVCYEK